MWTRKSVGERSEFGARERERDGFRFIIMIYLNRCLDIKIQFKQIRTQFLQKFKSSRSPVCEAHCWRPLILLKLVGLDNLQFKICICKLIVICRRLVPTVRIYGPNGVGRSLNRILPALCAYCIMFVCYELCYELLAAGDSPKGPREANGPNASQRTIARAIRNCDLSPVTGRLINDRLMSAFVFGGILFSW